MNNAAQTSTLHDADIPASSSDQERERIHRSMLSTVSHDLKTPLASIIGSLEIYGRMKNALSPDKQAALIKVALQEAHRLDNFITNILDMAKLEGGLVKPKQEDAEIGALLRDCQIRMQYHLQDSTVEVEPVSGPLKTMTDTLLLSRVISLVLDNAVKYGGLPAVIKIKFGKNGDRMGYISIQDNGRGIPANQTEAIFSKYIRFGREDQSNAGTGLGLAIAREIMKLLNGDITAANHPDGGAVFTLHLPLK